MKKKILMASLAVNIIAGVFVLWAFTGKAKNVNDSGAGSYISIRVQEGSGLKSGLSVSDGNSILSNIELNTIYSLEKMRENNQNIAKKLNELKSQGYEIVSSNG